MGNHPKLSSETNFRIARIAVLLSFTTNTGINIVLLGILARLGGIDLVGKWSLLMAVNMNVLVLDFGLTTALTLQVSRTGIDATAPILRLLSRLGMYAGVSGVLFLIVTWQLNWPISLAIGLATLSALAQLVSNWLITIRMGQHQQHWFNFKTVLRVVVQAGVVIALISKNTENAWLVFGYALFAGGLAELGLIYLIIRKEIEWTGTIAKLASLKSLTSGFGVENIAQRAIQPLYQMLIASLLGPAAVGIFTVALRIPVAINQAFGEALRTLLPGVSSLLQSENRRAAQYLVRDGFLSQVMLVIPASLYLLFHTELILVVWLGEASDVLTLAIKIFAISMVLTALGAPFYWVAHATGRVHDLGKLGIITLVAVLICAALSASVGGGIITFVVVYALGQTAGSLGAFFYGSNENIGLGGISSDLQWNRLIAFATSFIVFNICLIKLVVFTSPFSTLGVITGLNAALFGPIILFAISKKVMIKNVQIA